MKPTINLIPRFNLDYYLKDFIYGLKSIFLSNNFDLKVLNQLFGNKDFFFTNSGRTSLYVILRALKLPKGSKVGVPLYSCTAVFDAIIQAGYIPCFIDIDLNNFTMDSNDLANKIDELSAIVMIHTFGRPADIDDIKKVAKDTYIIEDCAHSLLSEYKGKKTGTFGVASFYSFRSRKYISAGEGSMIILNNGELYEDFQKEMDLLRHHSTLNEIKHSIFTYLLSFLYHEPWYGLLAFPLVSSMRERRGLSVNSSKKKFKTKRIRKCDFRIFLMKLEAFKEKVEQQRKNSFRLFDELENTPWVIPYEKEGTYCNYYLFPILFESVIERNNAHIFLRKIGVDTTTLWSKTVLMAKEKYGYEGDCHNAEKCSDAILTIPNYHTLCENKLFKIANCVTKLVELT